MAVNTYDPKTGVYTPVATAKPKPVTPVSASTANSSAPGYKGSSMSADQVRAIADNYNKVTAHEQATNTMYDSGTNTYKPNPVTVQAPKTQIGTAVSTNTPHTAQPMSAGQAQAQPPKDYAALAAARTALAIQQKQTIANQQKASAQSAYDQQNLRTKDDRVLGDFSRTQTANPFGNMGRTSFNEGLIGRERTQQDADAAAALTTQKANIDQMLADYQNATADEQVRIADELERADRDYQLNLAKFNQDQSNWDKTYNQNQQQIDYSQDPTNPNNQGQIIQNQGQTIQNQLAQYQLDDYPAESKAKATLLEQQVKSGALSNEAATYNLQQLKDPNSPANQAAKIDLQLKQLDLKNAPEKARLEVQQLQKQIAEIGKVHYKPQTAAEIAQDKVTLAMANKQLEDIGKGIYPGAKGDDKPQTAESYSSYLDGVSKYIKDDETGANVLSNPNDVMNAIELSNMSDYEKYKAYKARGLPWDDPVPKQ